MFDQHLSYCTFFCSEKWSTDSDEIYCQEHQQPKQWLKSLHSAAHPHSLREGSEGEVFELPCLIYKVNYLKDSCGIEWQNTEPVKGFY